MPAVVGAAGSLLGGLAAQKLMGTPKVVPGGGTPGLTTSTGPGKNGAGGSVQIDPAQVMAYYQKAADAQATGYNQGLAYYKDAMSLAATQVKASFTDANNTLRPLSESSNAALNEQMRMMGLDPVAKTSGSMAQAAQLGANDSIQTQLGQADKIQDPTARAQARQDIMNGISTQNSQSLAGIQQQIGQLEKNAPQAPQRVAGNIIVDKNMDFAQQVNVNGKNMIVGNNSDYVAQNGDIADMYEADMKTFKEQQAKYDSQMSELQGQLSAAQTKATDLQNFANQWNVNYSDTYDKGYTGQQVTDKIESTPGYSTIVDQGTKAVERQGAAQGMLGSANTEIALQNFGQQTAQSYYTSYMDNLSKIVNEGSGATTQIAANQVSQGGMLANIDQLVGTAAMDTSRAIGQYAADNLTHQGDMWYQIAATNANLQQKQTALSISQQQANQQGQQGQQNANSASTSANAQMIQAIGGL